MKKAPDRRKNRAIVAAVRQLRALDQKLESLGALQAAYIVFGARVQIIDAYRELFERRPA